MSTSKYVRLFVALILAISLACPAWGQGAAQEEQPDPCMAPAAEAIVFDTLIMRPLGLVSMVAGFALSILCYPFALASDSEDSVTQKLLYEPFAFTFLRPVGVDDYSFCRD
jgi:hypothetical protein